MSCCHLFLLYSLNLCVSPVAPLSPGRYLSPSLALHVSSPFFQTYPCVYLSAYLSIYNLSICLYIISSIYHADKYVLKSILSMYYISLYISFYQSTYFCLLRQNSDCLHSVVHVSCNLFSLFMSIMISLLFLFPVYLSDSSLSPRPSSLPPPINTHIQQRQISLVGKTSLNSSDCDTHTHTHLTYTHMLCNSQKVSVTEYNFRRL